MSHSGRAEKPAWGARQPGFSLLELMASLAVLLIVSGVVMSALMQMMMTQGTLSNRAEMHSSVRSATEVLQQEISQAGRVSLPGPALPGSVTLAAAVTATGSTSVTVSSAAGMFVGEQLLIDAGANQETVKLTAVSVATNQITAIFNNTHLNGAPVAVVGAFASGIVPTNAANGSTGTVLKMYGDINGDGNMVYVEYTCDTTGGNLLRNVMPFDAVTKSNPQVLLPNILPNPGGTPCFSYLQKTVGADTYVVDVSITLTVQTQNPDPKTNQFQRETKALLNVSPRNIFEGWQLAGASQTNRVQPMPPSVAALLAQ